MKSESEVAQSCPTLSNPMDCSLPGSSTHGSFQARVLEWGALAFSIYANDTTLMAVNEEELNSLLMRMKEEREKAGLKLNFQKSKIMATGPITSWQIDGKKWKPWQVLFSWAPISLQMVLAAMKLKDAYSLK